MAVQSSGNVDQATAEQIDAMLTQKGMKRCPCCPGKDYHALGFRQINPTVYAGGMIVGNGINVVTLCCINCGHVMDFVVANPT